METNGRAARIDGIHTALPGGKFFFERVDTNNDFMHEGKRYHVDPSVEGYGPKETTDGCLYDMDTIVVVNHEGTLYFFQQNYQPIEERYIQLATAS